MCVFVCVNKTEMQNLSSSNRLQQVNLRQQLLCKRIQILTILEGGPAASHQVISNNKLPPRILENIFSGRQGRAILQIAVPNIHIAVCSLRQLVSVNRTGMHNLESSSRSQQVSPRRKLLCKRIQILTILGECPAAPDSVISSNQEPPLSNGK